MQLYDIMTNVDFIAFFGKSVFFKGRSTWMCVFWKKCVLNLREKIWKTRKYCHLLKGRVNKRGKMLFFGKNATLWLNKGGHKYVFFFRKNVFLKERVKKMKNREKNCHLKVSKKKMGKMQCNAMTIQNGLYCNFSEKVCF